MVRLDIPPPRTDDGQKYAFVEYKNPEDCEKALELDGKPLPFAIKEGLTVQMARLDPFLRRNRPRSYRGGYDRDGGYGYLSGGYGSRSGYGSRYGSRGGYGYDYEARGGGGSYGPDSYLHGYGPYRGGREHGYGPYGAPPGRYMSGPMPYPRDYDSNGYRGLYDDYRGGYAPRDRYDRDRSDRSDRGDRGRRRGDRGDASGEQGSEPLHSSHEEQGSNAEPVEYDRGRYPRADSPRDKNRSRSPSR